jgi:hypothetical protein
VFEVWGDGRLLWNSKPLVAGNPPESCTIALKGVDTMELHTRSQGSHLGNHAVWIEPRVLQDVDTPDN